MTKTEKMLSARELAFRIFYNSIYYILYLVLLALLIVSPADMMRQRHDKTDILLIAATYFVTILVVSFIYATRLYINRSVLASIPKTWIPIEKGDGLPGDVRRMIVNELGRSAAIAFEARPRVPLLTTMVGGGKTEENGGHKIKGGVMAKLSCTGSAADDDGAMAVISIPPDQPPVWGEIEHFGWASPLSADLPNLQYDTVVTELPNLVEAKALTLAPPDLDSATEPPMLDPDVVALLQRPTTMGLREYLGNLSQLGVLSGGEVVGQFVAQYEKARFGVRPLKCEQFRSLMHLFAEVLRGMRALDPDVLQQLNDDDGGYDDYEEEEEEEEEESDIDNDAPREEESDAAASSLVGTEQGEEDEQHSSSQRNAREEDGLAARLHKSSSSSSTSASPSRSQRRRRRQTPGNATPRSVMAGGVRNSSANTWQTQYRTAPTTPKSLHTVATGDRLTLRSSSSSDSFAQTRRPYEPVEDEEYSSGRSMRSGVSASNGSVVIRLASNEEGTVGGLPYVLRHPHTA
ncbi:hypothetical protein B0H66DRAFT_642611 [Apodospora peruviana]|uniref:Defect at low temperature protein 1 n=1 Tax=Apodospora peruviana TaxID=516989 RepID=A0AAE0M145_9PEZI|nr:hypothetical protein B0H66DRAFT_642611 [Apodospora peruviana]